MTAFAACLFTIAAVASAWSILATVRRFGAGATTLRAQLAACPATLTIEWKRAERLSAPALVEFRKRPARRGADRIGLEWPQTAMLDLAA